MSITDAPWRTRRLRWPLEAGLVQAWLALARRMPVQRASDMGARVGRAIGPRIPYSRRAHQNMRLALPEADAAARRRILDEMWTRLGRLVAEYPHLSRLGDPGAGYVTCEGLERLDDVRAGRRAAIVVTTHFSGFEVLNVLLSRLVGETLFIVRAPNNPHVVAPLDAARRIGGGTTSRKGVQGARDATRTLKRNGLVLMLPDQRMSEGVEASFFGHAAGTPPGPAQLALRHNVPLLPVRMRRTGSVGFHMTVEPPLSVPDPGDPAAHRLALTEAMNRRFEAWIRETPEEWLWLHRRWPKALYATLPA